MTACDQLSAAVCRSNPKLYGANPIRQQHYRQHEKRMAVTQRSDSL